MNNIVKKRLRQAKIVSTLIIAMPFTRCVILNGSLAQGKSKINSDIDILVICKFGKLYLARIFTIFVVWLTGLKRSSDEEKDHSGKICLNYYLTDNFLIIPHDRDEDTNKYCAQNYSQAIFLAGDGKIFNSFMEINIAWMKNYLENLEPRILDLKQKNKRRGMNRLKQLLEKVLSGKSGQWLEIKSKQLQIKRINRDSRIPDYPNFIVANDYEIRLHPPRKK